MTLLDTNVLIYASDHRSPFHHWAREIVANCVTSDGAAINAAGLAELCVGDSHPETVADRLQRWGIVLLDIPATAAELCASAYSIYRRKRYDASGRDAPAMPLPDFFIGAHAQVMGWSIATADEGRFKTYFPSVQLRKPSL